MARDQTRDTAIAPAAAAPPLGAGGRGEARLYLREDELDRAAALFQAASRAFFRTAEPPLAQYGLGPAHYRALAAIRREPDMTVGGLIAALGVRKQSLARVLNELEQAGLLARAPSARDRRARVLRLTDAGRAAEQAASAALRERLAAVFRAAGADAVAGARTVLEALLIDEPPSP